MTNVLYTQRRATLEDAIAQAGFDLYLVPMVDAFQGEYIPPHDARLPYMTGFTGSAGMGAFWAAPTAARPHTLFVDGRYTLQAANEVDTTAITVRNSGDITVPAWCIDMAGSALRIGLDPWLVTMRQFEQWVRDTAQVDIQWIAYRPNLVDSICSDQPAPPTSAVALHPLACTGRSYAEKRADMLAAMAKQHADALLFTQADAINWLLNIRAGDIAYNPLLLGYFILQSNGAATLYTHARAFDAEVQAYFAENNITTAAIEPLFDGAAPALATGARVMMDSASTPYGWQLLAEKAGWQVIQSEDPTQLPKAIKNHVELEGIRAAHVRDGLALTKFLHWLDGRNASAKFPNELEIVDKLESFRAAHPLYRGPSFATIAGSGDHGAIIHYRANGASNRRLRAGELFLLDSGGQYRDGTTDVTRTIAVGIPTPAARDHFTRVLKGHIALASAVFPTGTTGSQLDILARQYLWSAGLDYDHGTGHGVGAYLCVHEGPQRISKRGSTVALAPGMIVSNEPGYYLPGSHGIRIESLVAVIASARVNGWLGFETLTLAPIDNRLIDVTMLTSDERNWLNDYHRRVYDTHAPHIGSVDARSWLAQVTRAI